MPSEDTGCHWQLFDFRGTGTWPELWPPVEWRAVSSSRILFSSTPCDRSVNRYNMVHGAFLAGYSENCACLFLMDRFGQQCGITISLALSYPGSARGGLMLEGEADLIRETGKLMFVRLTVLQGGETVIFGDSIIRKLPPQ